MFVAVARIEIHIPEAASLKDKRAVVQSVIQRLRNRFRVAVAEVDAVDNRALAVVGVAALSGSASHAREVIDAAVRFVDRSRLEADIGAVDVDIIQAL